MSTTQTLSLPVPATRPHAAMVAVKAAVSTLVQLRNGARVPARVLYYETHSLLRALRQHLRNAA